MLNGRGQQRTNYIHLGEWAMDKQYLTIEGTNVFRIVTKTETLARPREHRYDMEGVD
jgi:hypothetical protein